MDTQLEAKFFSNLAHADDSAVTNRDIQELQDFVNALAANAKDISLEINLKKTDFMTTDKTKHQLDIKIYEKIIKQVTEFVYFGHKVSSTNNQEIPVKYRIGLGWGCFWKT